MIKKISIVLITVVALVLIYATTKPESFMVSRTVSIKAPPQKIFALIEDLHNWHQWSPYENLDPNIKKTFSGADKGNGSAVAWEGNAKVGTGAMVITDATFPFKVTMKSNIKKPLAGHYTSDFTLEEKDGLTIVTWSSYGNKNYTAKLLSIFFDCEKMMGKSLEDGLSKLKSVSENK